MRIILSLLLLCLTATAHANPRVIGILGGEQNQNLHTADIVFDNFLNSDVPLYEKPKDKKGPALKVKGKEIYGDSYILNRKGLLVYAKKPYSWYMVGYGGRAYWIDVLPNVRFYPYYDLVRARPPYLKQWDWKIYDNPGGTPTIVNPEVFPKHHRDHPPVEVADQIEHEGEVWYRIKILDSTCYELSRPAKVAYTGWIPAYQPDNERTLWFNPRQCK